MFDLYIEKLENAIQLADETGNKNQFIDTAYDITDDLEQEENNFQALPEIFKLIERSPNIDYGGPGPLGSFMEKYYKKGYEEELIASLKRKGTNYTIFLLMRCINDHNNVNRDSYIKLVKTFEDEEWLEDFWKEKIGKL